MRATSFLAVLLVFAACTVTAPDEDPIMGDDGSGGTATPSPDPDPDPDPSPDPDPDPDPDPGETDTCPPKNFGRIESLKDPSATIDRMDPDDPESPAVRWLDAMLDADSTFELGLWDGYGAFAQYPPEPGDYPIAGADESPTTCGLCFEVRFARGAASHRMFATGGVLSLESVDGNLTGNATTVSLQEFDEDGAIVEGGCGALIEHVSFDAPLEPLF